MFEKLKKAFGFGAIDENDELIADDPEVHNFGSSPFEGGDNSQPLTDASIDETASEIFDHVVRQFNNALPDFLKNSVDPEREKKQLYDSLTADLKAHLASLENSVKAKLDKSWRDEREKLQTELQTISRTAKDIEAKRNELKTQQLSADRQKRAMTERIHELERQLKQSEADKEQLELENKSMLNKVKVAQVYEKDIEAMQQQIAELQSKLNERLVDTGSGDKVKEIETVKEVIVDDPEKNAKIAALEKDNKDLLERVEKLSSVEEEYMDLVSKMEAVEEQLNQIEQLTSSKDAKIKDFQTKLDEAQRAAGNDKAEIRKLTELLEQANKKIAELETEDKQPETPQPEPAKAEATATNGRMSADDDILTDTDWIVKPNAKNEGRGKDEGRRKSKKPSSPKDDGQMSLW